MTSVTAPLLVPRSLPKAGAAHVDDMRHSELRLDAVYEAAGRPSVVLTTGKYVLDRRSDAIELAPKGESYFGAMVLTFPAPHRIRGEVRRTPSPQEYAAERIAELVDEAAHLRSDLPRRTFSDVRGFCVRIVRSTDISGPWEHHVARRSREEAAAEERANLKRAYAAVLAPSVTTSAFADLLEKHGRLAGAIDLDVLVPDERGLLREVPGWSQRPVLEPTYNFGLSDFLKGEAGAALRRGFGETTYFTHLSTRRDLAAATRGEGGWVVPVEVIYEVLSEAEYLRRLNAVSSALR